MRAGLRTVQPDTGWCKAGLAADGGSELPRAGREGSASGRRRGVVLLAGEGRDAPSGTGSAARRTGRVPEASTELEPYGGGVWWRTAAAGAAGTAGGPSQAEQAV